MDHTRSRRGRCPVPRIHSNQPTHLYLGTTNSWIYESLDQGGTWHRLAELDSSEDVVIDNIVVDAANPTGSGPAAGSPISAMAACG